MPRSFRSSQIVAAAVLVLSLVIVLMAQRAPAAAPAPADALKIGLVDSQKVMIESKLGKAGIADLKAMQEKFALELQPLEKEVKDLRTRMAEGRATLPQARMEELAKQAEEKTIILRRRQDEMNRDLKKKRDDMLASIDTRLMPVINQIAKENGYTLIFRKFESGLVYADDSMDITAAIIQRIDAGPAAGGR